MFLVLWSEGWILTRLLVSFGGLGNLRTLVICCGQSQDFYKFLYPFAFSLGLFFVPFLSFLLPCAFVFVVVVLVFRSFPLCLSLNFLREYLSLTDHWPVSDKYSLKIFSDAGCKHENSELHAVANATRAQSGTQCVNQLCYGFGICDETPNIEWETANLKQIWCVQCLFQC